MFSKFHFIFNVKYGEHHELTQFVLSNFQLQVICIHHISIVLEKSTIQFICTISSLLGNLHSFHVSGLYQLHQFVTE
ncbi:hypothetical protein HOF65_05970 [bacterium]|nr:hypothetical protein [bacterium]